MSYMVLPSTEEAAAGNTYYGLPITGQTTVYRAGDDGHFQTGIPDGGSAALVQQLGDGPDAATRFTDNSDGTVTDHMTGLMWVQNFHTVGQQSWNDAIDYCLALNYAGHTDWRLPNMFEAVSIIEMEGMSIPTPPLTDTSIWTSTTNPGATVVAAVVYPAGGSIVSFAAKTDFVTYYAAAVRGGIYNNNTA